ncbi:MAG: hypothetical protein R3C10_10830 [Pirellulales bacterium]
MNPSTGEESSPVDPVYIDHAEIIHDDQNGIVRLSGLQEIADGSNTFQVKIRAVDSNGDFDPSEDLTIVVHVEPPVSAEAPRT